jgi:uncharacterized protein (TIGR00251 family)
MDWPCMSDSGGGTTLEVSVVPNARKTEAVGLHDGALRVRLAAPAIEGRANDALVQWLARELGIARRAVTLRHGALGRRKRLQVDCPAAHVRAWLDNLGL